MSERPAYPAKVFYDGSCRVCSGEMDAYMRREHGGRLQFVDISDPDFEPAVYGISLDDFMYQMHVIDRKGTVFKGPDAFRAIWRAFPESHWFRFLSALIGWPVVRSLARLAYRLFARIRKYLPKRKSGVCKIGRRPPR